MIVALAAVRRVAAARPKGRTFGIRLARARRREPAGRPGFVSASSDA